MLKKLFKNLGNSHRVKALMVLFLLALLTSLALAISVQEYTSLVFTLLFFPAILIVLEKLESSSNVHLSDLRKMRKKVTKIESGSIKSSSAVSTAAVINYIEEAITQLAASGNSLSTKQISDYLKRFDQSEEVPPSLREKMDTNTKIVGGPQETIKNISGVLRSFLADVDRLATPTGAILLPSQVVSLERVISSIRPRYIYMEESIVLSSQIDFDEVFTVTDGDIFTAVKKRGSCLVVVNEETYASMLKPLSAGELGTECTIAVVFSDHQRSPETPANFTPIVPGGLLSMTKVFYPTDRINENLFIF